MRSPRECSAPLRAAANALLRREDIERSAARVRTSHYYVLAGLENLPLEDARRLLRSVRGVRARLMLAVQTSGEDEAWGYHLRDAYGLTGLGQLIETGAKVLHERSRAHAREQLQLRHAA